MTTKDTITLEEAIKSKDKFTQFVEEQNEKYINEVLQGYPERSLNIVLPQLTPNSEGLVEALKIIKANQKCYVFWFIVNEKENITKLSDFLNNNFVNGCGVFIFKAVLTDDKTAFKCILKPSVKCNERVKVQSKTNSLQLDYWNKYVEVCDEIGAGNYQITPKAQHYADIRSNIKSVGLKQTVSFKENYVATEINLNNKSKYDILLEHKGEIQKQTGELVWHNLASNKNSTIRFVYDTDLSNPENYIDAIKVQIEKAELLCNAARDILERT